MDQYFLISLLCQYFSITEQKIRVFWHYLFKQRKICYFPFTFFFIIIMMLLTLHTNYSMFIFFSVTLHIKSTNYFITNFFYWSYSLQLAYISFFNIPPLLSIIVQQYYTGFVPQLIDIQPTLRLLWHYLRFLWFSMDFHAYLMKMRLWQLPPYTFNDYVFSDLSAYGSIFWTFRRVKLSVPLPFIMQAWRRSGSLEFFSLLFREETAMLFRLF